MSISRRAGNLLFGAAGRMGRFGTRHPGAVLGGGAALGLMAADPFKEISAGGQEFLMGDRNAARTIAKTSVANTIDDYGSGSGGRRATNNYLNNPNGIQRRSNLSSPSGDIVFGAYNTRMGR